MAYALKMGFLEKSDKNWSKHDENVAWNIFLNFKFSYRPELPDWGWGICKLLFTIILYFYY